MALIAIPSAMMPAMAHDMKATGNTEAGDMCTTESGWTRIENVKVTACCVPDRADYKSDSAFNKAVKAYGGWGKRGPHDYVYWDAENGTWEHSDMAMTSHLHMAGPDSLVADPNFVAYGSKVKIDGLPERFASMTFTANDMGPAFEGQRWVNFSAGEGAEACRIAELVGERYSTIWIKKDD
jgi:hypothetical protein